DLEAPRPRANARDVPRVGHAERGLHLTAQLVERARERPQALLVGFFVCQGSCGCRVHAAEFTPRPVKASLDTRRRRQDWPVLFPMRQLCRGNASHSSTNGRDRCTSVVAVSLAAGALIEVETALALDDPS